MGIARTSHRSGMRRMSWLAMLIPCLASACVDESLTGPQVEDAPVFAAETASTVGISGIQVASGYSYVAAGGLTAGATPYIDRSWTYAAVPSALAGQWYIRTRQDDRTVAGVACAALAP